QCALDRDAALLGLDDDRNRHQRRFVAVEIFHELLDAALIAHRLGLLLGVALVGEYDRDARIEERELATAVFERRKIELDHREGLRRRQERLFGSAPAIGIADDAERRDRIAVGELHEVL